MNTKMKVLSLALVGLCGFAGTAMAACPTSPVPPWTNAVNLPDVTSSPLAIATGGLDGSECKLTAALDSSVAAASFVRYTHAASEPRYRFQFYVDNTNLTSFEATDSVVLFQAPASTAANGFNRVLRVSLVGGPAGAKRVRFIAQCAGGTHICAQTYATDLQPGVNIIQGDLTVGASGSFKYWVNPAAGSTEPQESGSIPNIGDTSAWGGVAAANLGLSAPSQGFADGHGGELVGFDAFDSRRQTYIGH